MMMISNGTVSAVETFVCSSSVSQSVTMVSCVSNYLQSLITDTVANKPQSAACRGRQARRTEKICQSDRERREMILDITSFFYIVCVNYSQQVCLCFSDVKSSPK